MSESVLLPAGCGCLVTQSQQNNLIITKSNSHHYLFSFMLRLDLNSPTKNNWQFYCYHNKLIKINKRKRVWKCAAGGSRQCREVQFVIECYSSSQNEVACSLHLLKHGAQWRGRGHQWLPDLSGLYMHFRFTFLLVTALRSSQCLPRLAYSTAAWIAIVVQRTSLFVSLYMPLICHDFQDLRPDVCKSHVCFSASTCAPMLSATFCSIAWTICQMLLDF